MYARLCFLDGETGHAVVDALTHTDGVLVHGATAASLAATVDALAEVYDTGEYHDIGADTGAGRVDEQWRQDDYTLTWHVGFGYVALVVDVDEHGQRSDELWATCRGCGQPVDYCLDHTHSPDTESPEWVDDYEKVHAAVTDAVYQR